MKRSRFVLKILAVAMLSVLLILFSVGSPAFSWFDRPNSLSGNSMSYAISGSTFTNKNLETGLIAYDGNNVTITGNQYSSDGVNYTDENTIASFVTSHTLAPGKRDYYKTTITNNSTTSQNVSLYIADLASSNANGELSVGVNSPVKAYKNYSLMASNNNVNYTNMVGYTASTTVRIYLNPKDAWGSNGWGSNTVEIQYSTSTLTGHSGGTFADMTSNGKNGDGDPIYYYDVPQTTKSVCFHVKGQSSEWSWTSIKSVSLTARQSVVLWAIDDNGGYKDNGYGQVDLGGPTNVDGPYFIRNYDDNTKVYMRSTQSMAYAQTTDYIGHNATYESTNTSYFTVNASSGVITPKAPGTAYLKITIRGSEYNDVKTYQSKVTIAALVLGTATVEDAPVVTNILLEPGEEANIRWFIMNDKSASSNVSYTLSRVYVGL